MLTKPNKTACLSLLFWEHFPGEQAGDCIELTVTPKKHSWVGGRQSDYLHLDSELTFTDNKTAPVLSRLHFTIYFDRRNQEWILIDGGVFSGDTIPTRSKNGVWVRSEETDNRWEQVSGQIKICPHTFIWLGPAYRIIIAEDCVQSTVGGYLWEDTQWQLFATNVTEPPLIDESIFKDLARSREPTLFSVIQDWSDWLQSTPVNKVDLINRVFVFLAVVLMAVMALTYVHLRTGGDLPGVQVEEPVG